MIAGPPNSVCSIHGGHSFAAQPGHHLVPQPLSSGRNVFEELGPGFTLLALDAEDHAVQEFRRAAESPGIPLEVLRDTYAGERTAYESRLVLVRPDQYVVWAGNEPPENTAGLLRKITGSA